MTKRVPQKRRSIFWGRGAAGGKARARTAPAERRLAATTVRGAWSSTISPRTASRLAIPPASSKPSRPSKNNPPLASPFWGKWRVAGDMGSRSRRQDRRMTRYAPSLGGGKGGGAFFGKPVPAHGKRGTSSFRTQAPTAQRAVGVWVSESPPERSPSRPLLGRGEGGWGSAPP